MEIEPERIERMYFVRYRDTARKKWITTTWRMNEEDAAKHFADREYEILWQSKEERVVGGDPLMLSMARFNAGTPTEKL